MHFECIVTERPGSVRRSLISLVDVTSNAVRSAAASPECAELVEGVVSYLCGDFAGDEHRQRTMLVREAVNLVLAHVVNQVCHHAATEEVSIDISPSANVHDACIVVSN